MINSTKNIIDNKPETSFTPSFWFIIFFYKYIQINKTAVKHFQYKYTMCRYLLSEQKRSIQWTFDGWIQKLIYTFSNGSFYNSIAECKEVVRIFVDRNCWLQTPVISCRSDFFTFRTPYGFCNCKITVTNKNSVTSISCTLLLNLLKSFNIITN